MRVTTELGFTIEPPATGGPVVTPRDVQLLMKVLEGGVWMTASEIAHHTGDSDRKIRAIASAACPQVISYPGSPGYRLMSACTIEEINHCIAALQSQGTEMLKRAALITRAYHQRGAVSRS